MKAVAMSFAKTYQLLVVKISKNDVLSFPRAVAHAQQLWYL